jgi:hypothetical protein
LQNSKTTHTKNTISFASELRFLANLGFFEKLRKGTTTLHRETPINVKRKIPNVERCETFQSEELIKPLNSKTQ